MKVVLGLLSVIALLFSCTSVKEGTVEPDKLRADEIIADESTIQVEPEGEEEMDLTGSWEGKLDAGAAGIRIVFNLEKDTSGIYSGTIDSPDQGANGFGISLIEIKAAEIYIESAVIAAAYKGVIENDKIIGTWIQSNMEFPLNMEKLDKAPDYTKPQDPVEPYPYNSMEVSFSNREAEAVLSGTLTYPKGEAPFIAVILATGSGPQNRNEEILGHKPFLVLSDFLTRRGVAVLRYDDRGTWSSTGNYSEATTIDFADDALKAVEFLKSQKTIQISSIGIIGHSEGGYIALDAADRSQDVNFFVMMAGMGCTGYDILVQQTEAILKAQGIPEKEIETAIKSNITIYNILRDNISMEEKEKKLHGIYSSLGMPNEQMDNAMLQVLNPWFIDFIDLDLVPVLERTTIPVLAINGSKDLQVLPAENLSAIEKALTKAGNKHFTVKEYDGLNHLFQTASTGLMDEYGIIEETISPDVLEFIADWILNL